MNVTRSDSDSSVQSGLFQCTFHGSNWWISQTARHDNVFIWCIVIYVFLYFITMKCLHFVNDLGIVESCDINILNTFKWISLQKNKKQKCLQRSTQIWMLAFLQMCTTKMTSFSLASARLQSINRKICDKIIEKQESEILAKWYL